MHAAIVRQASDIHIDPGGKASAGPAPRGRSAGAVPHAARAPRINGVISRFKVLGGMDIAEKRAPQDGHFTHRFGPTGQAIDVRLATLPTKLRRADDGAAAWPCKPSRSPWSGWA